MGRLPKAIQQTVSLPRVNPNAAFTGTPNMLAGVANVAGNLSGALLQKKREIEAVEEQRQQALNTIKMNRAGIDMSREMSELQNKVTMDYQNNPAAGEEVYRKEAEVIRAKYENSFVDDPKTLAQFSGISSGIMRSFDSRVTSWKSSQEIINATGDFRTAQDGLIEMAGNAANLAELQTQLKALEANGATAGPWLMKDGKDVAAVIRKDQATAVKQFIYGQLENSPEKALEYLKDETVEANLTESEALDLKHQAKAEINARKAEAETLDIINFVEDYYNMRAMAREGGLSIKEINTKIEAAKTSGASKGRLEMLYQLRDSLHKDLVDERNAAIKEQQRMVKEEAKTNAYVDVITSYNELFNKKGQLADDKTSLEEVVKLQSKITDYQKQGLVGDMSDFEKRIISATRNRLEKSSTVYKKHKDINPGNNILSLLNPFDDKEEPIDEFNTGIKSIVDWADKDYSTSPPAVYNSIKAVAVSDYIRNYQKYKQAGMSDADIIIKVKQDAQQAQRIKIQEKVDAEYNTKKTNAKKYEFKTVAEAEAAKLPKGTIVYINGRRAVIE